MRQLFNANQQTLKFRLTALVAGLVLLAAGLVAFASLYLAERQMAAIVGAQQFALLSSAAGYIDEDLSSRRTLLAMLREELAPPRRHDRAALQGWLEAHGSLRDEFFNMTVFDAAGNVLANLNNRAIVGKVSARERPYFKDTVRTRDGLVSAPFRSALSGRPVVLVTEPVYQADGALLYVLAGSIDLQRPRFFGHLEALKPGISGYLFMLTGDGTIIHHRDKERILKRVTEEAGGAVPSTLAALKGFEGTVVARNKRGVESLISYKRLARADWIIGAVYPVDEALTPLIAMRGKSLVASALVALLAGVAGGLAIWRILRPLASLREKVGRIVDGSARIEVFDSAGKDEIGDLSRAFFTLSRQRRAAEMEMASLARTDPLTGINNRRMFEEIFALALGRAARQETRLVLAYLDIDHFKSINDQYGHGVGDRVLVEFAARLKQAVRNTDSVARLAGDEFVVIFEGAGGDATPEALAQKILDAVAPPFVIGGLSLMVTTSVGIALDGAPGATLDQYLAAADEALYGAKAAGRRRYAIERMQPLVC